MKLTINIFDYISEINQQNFAQICLDMINKLFLTSDFFLINKDKETRKKKIKPFFKKNIEMLLLSEISYDNKMMKC